MNVGWKVMIPWGLVNLVAVAVWMEYGGLLAQRLGLSVEPSMALAGWSVLLVSWLVVTVADPTSAGNRPRRLRGTGDIPE
jgi:hypothetical protein